MKKLMIAAAIVCAAAMSQASTYNWVFSSDGSAIMDGWKALPGGEDTSENSVGAGLSAYLIAYSATTMNQDTILSGLRNGKTIETIAGSSLLSTATTIADGSFTSAQWSDEVGGTMTAFEVILNNDGSYAYLSTEDSFNASLHPLETTVAFSVSKTKYNQDGTGTAAFGDRGWYAVPEPTSGLLLLLGVAGLALRRRRA